MLKIYDLGKFAKGFKELNVAIVNGESVILSDNEAVHTVHSMDDMPLSCSNVTVREIINSEPVGEVEDLGMWVRKFGSRIEFNYAGLLDSIKRIGLNPEEYPRE